MRVLSIDKQEISCSRQSLNFAPNWPSLLIYSLMFDPTAQTPCPMCNSIVDNFARINLAIVGKAPAQKLNACTSERGWNNLRILSSEKTTYNRDYGAEDADGHQLPAVNVFTRRNGIIYHFYNTEILYCKVDGDPRHADLLSSLWNIFDLTPEGRGTDWYPKFSY